MLSNVSLMYDVYFMALIQKAQKFKRNNETMISFSNQTLKAANYINIQNFKPYRW
jgi:hypothetical protein